MHDAKMAGDKNAHRLTYVCVYLAKTGSFPPNSVRKRTKTVFQLPESSFICLVNTPWNPIAREKYNYEKNQGLKDKT